MGKLTLLTPFSENLRNGQNNGYLPHRADVNVILDVVR